MRNKPKQLPEPEQKIDIDKDTWTCGNCGHHMVKPKDIDTREHIPSVKEVLTKNNEAQMAITICSRCGDIIALWLDKGVVNTKKLHMENLMHLPGEYLEKILLEAIPIRMRWIMRGSPKEHDQNN